jgi:hypothetical protein
VNNGRLRRAAALTLFAAFVLAAPLAATADDQDHGLIERLSYDLFFGPLPVGQARIASFALQSPVGDLRHVVFEAESFALVDMVIKVRDRAESVYDQSQGRSLWYMKSLMQEGQLAARQTRFNWNHSVARQIISGQATARVRMPAGTLDPLAVLFAIRGLELPPGEVRQKMVTDGATLASARFDTGAQEEIQVPAGTFTTLAVQVDLDEVEAPLHTAGTNRFTVWVAPGAGNLPVKITAPIDLGPFSGTLHALLVRAETHPLE